MLGVKSSQTPQTLGMKGSRTPHTLGIKGSTYYKSAPNPSAYVDKSHVVENQNLSEYAPIGPGVNPYKSKNKSRLER